MVVKVNCSRCGAEMLSGANWDSIALEESIDCAPATRKFLSKTCYQSICKHCLSDINNLVLDVRKEEDVSELKEGKHYYMEGGYMVFTEYFHMIRGYCCKSNCRHCAYGFNPKNLVKRVK